MQKTFVAGAALSSALLLGSCSASPIETVETFSEGTLGNRVTISDESLERVSGDITVGLQTIFSKNLCSIDLTVEDIKKYPDLENVGKRGIAAGRGFSGGKLYIAGDIQPSEGINIKQLSAHEGLHACVSTTRQVAENITAPSSDLTGKYIRGFSVLNSLEDKGYSGSSSLDEAAVEWIARQIIPEENKDTGYGQITALFQTTAHQRKLTVQQVSKLHEDSDIAGVVGALSGKEPTVERIGCVVLQFAKLQDRYVDFRTAKSDLNDC